jgi:uridine kinase
VLVAVARRIEEVAAGDGARVAIDGVDGVGRSVFADELARVLETDGSTVVRASVDGFHQPPDVRYRRARGSPEGFYLDSHRYEELERVLLRPFGPGGSRRYRRAIYDVEQERALDLPEGSAAWNTILLIDGISCTGPGSEMPGTCPSSSRLRSR